MAGQLSAIADARRSRETERDFGVAEAHLGYVMVDESPLGATTGGVLATIAVVLGLGAGIGAGVYALKRRRRR